MSTALPAWQDLQRAARHMLFGSHVAVTQEQGQELRHVWAKGLYSAGLGLDLSLG
jgi:hypothetical protein